MKEIYLDNAATTKMSNKVIRAMNSAAKTYGNPSSPHLIGKEARKALENAKKRLAAKINCLPFEIVLTASGTESNNLLILGCAEAQTRKKKLIISSIEHSSIYEPAMELKRQGYEIVLIPIDREGIVDIEFLRREIDANTLLVSVIHANSETGVIQDIESIGKICREKGVLFHTDALQSFAKIPIDVKKMNVDLLSAGAHKIGGPKGIGLLYVRSGVSIKPLIYGGGQEKGLRSGTENVWGAMGFAVASEENNNSAKVRNVRNYFVKEVEKIGGKWNGSEDRTIYCHAHISFPGFSGQSIVSYLSEKGIMCSTGSACDSKIEEKRVLESIGLPDEEIKGAVRFVFSQENKKKDVDSVIKHLSTFFKLYR